MIEKYQERVRYRFFAYCVIRDAVGFYFGIPKFLANTDLTEAVEIKLKSKIRKFRKTKGEPTVEDISKLRASILKSAEYRREQLKEDYEYCKEVLFEKDSLYLQLLGLDPEFIKTYLDRLPENTKEQLAVVPSWRTPDYSLGRPYLNYDLDGRIAAL